MTLDSAGQVALGVLGVEGQRCHGDGERHPASGALGQCPVQVAWGEGIHAHFLLPQSDLGYENQFLNDPLPPASFQFSQCWAGCQAGRGGVAGFLWSPCLHITEASTRWGSAPLSVSLPHTLNLTLPTWCLSFSWALSLSGPPLQLLAVMTVLGGLGTQWSQLQVFPFLEWAELETGLPRGTAWKAGREAGSAGEAPSGQRAPQPGAVLRAAKQTLRAATSGMPGSAGSWVCVWNRGFRVCLHTHEPAFPECLVLYSG